MAQRVGRGIALLFLDRGTRKVWLVSCTPRTHLNPGKVTLPILQEAGWAPGPVWTGRKSRYNGILSRTVQSVVSRYTDWATRPTQTVLRNCVFVSNLSVMQSECAALYWHMWPVRLYHTLYCHLRTVLLYHTSYCHLSCCTTHYTATCPAVLHIKMPPVACPAVPYIILPPVQLYHTLYCHLSSCTTHYTAICPAVPHITLPPVQLYYTI